MSARLSRGTRYASLQQVAGARAKSEAGSLIDINNSEAVPDMLAFGEALDAAIRGNNPEICIKGLCLTLCQLAISQGYSTKSLTDLVQGCISGLLDLYRGEVN